MRKEQSPGVVPPVALGASRRHFERDGLNVAMEPWEDGARTDMAPGTFEWWYFDVHADDGTLIVIIFFTKPMIKINDPAAPFVNVRILTPDGVTHRVEATATPQSFRAARDHCDVAVGVNHASGDLSGYHLHIEIETVRCDLTFTPTSPPWRPGTGKIYFGKPEERFFSWIVPMPTGLMTGELEISGDRRKITGNGYHDHNWGTIPMTEAWNSWWWSRARIGDFTVLAVELKTTQAFGGKKLDLLMVARGNQLVVEDTERTQLVCHDFVLHPDSKKSIASRLSYHFEYEETSFELTLNKRQEIFRHNFLRKFPWWKKILARFMGVDPWYYRFRGDAKLNLTHAGKSFSGDGETVYERMYFGPN